MARTVREVVWVDGIRTPFGRATPTGLYAHTRADDLMARCLRELLRRNPNLPPSRIDEVALAATKQVGDQGLNLGRTAAILAGLPASVPGYALDRMCAGGLTAVTTVAAAIGVGAGEVAIAGGVEHMGSHPLGSGLDLNPRMRAPGLLAESALTMGATAENLHDRFPELTRARADEYAAASQQKFDQARTAGRIAWDLAPVAIRSPHGWGLATADERPRSGTQAHDLAELPTPFRVGGRVTAGNAAGLTDGAAAGLLAEQNTAADLGLTASMRLVSFAAVGVEPHLMGLGPGPAVELALRRGGLQLSDIGLIEINEAFAVQVLAFLQHFDLADADPRINVDGGAIAVGHPLAASGLRLLIQLARQFGERPQVRYGLTTMCVGLGMGVATIWENLRHHE